MRLLIYDLTDVQSGGSTITEDGMNNVWAAKAINNTDSADTFKEAVGAKSSSTTRNQVVFTSADDNDDGHVWVFGR